MARRSMYESSEDLQYIEVKRSKYESPTDLVIFVKDDQTRKTLYFYKKSLTDSSVKLKKMIELLTDRRPLELIVDNIEDFMNVLSFLAPRDTSDCSPVLKGNMIRILRLALKYELPSVVRECEKELIVEQQKVGTERQTLRFVYIAQQFKLDALLKESITRCAMYMTVELDMDPNYINISDRNMKYIYRLQAEKYRHEASTRVFHSFNQDSHRITLSEKLVKTFNSLRELDSQSQSVQDRLD